MKKLLILSAILGVASCSWNKEGPIFPEEEGVTEVVRYEGEEEFVVEENGIPLTREEVRVRYIEEEAPAAPAREISYSEDVGVYAEPAETDRIPVDRPRLAIEVKEDSNITPEVYSTLASRMTSRILDNTTSIYEVKKTPSIYVKEPIKKNKSLPNGLFYAKRTTKNIINGSKAFNVVNNMQDADYYLTSEMDVIEVEGLPVLQYKATLFDKDGKEIKTWTERANQITNDDRSWW